MKFLSINNASKFLSRRKNQQILLIAVAISTLISGFLTTQLKIDFELEKLFPQNDPDLEFYQKIINKNGYDNDFLLISISPNPSFFEEKFLTSSAAVIDSLRGLSGTTFLADPFYLPYLINSPTGIISIPIVHPDTPEKYENDSLRIAESSFHREYFNDFSFLSLYLKHRHFQDPDSAIHFYKKVRKILDKSDLEYNLTGKIPAESAFRKLIRQDFFLYLFFSVIIGLVVLGIIYRSTAYIFMPLIVGCLALIMTFGMMAAFSIPISIMSVLLPPLLLFTATSDTLHLINATKSNGLEGGIKKVVKPTFLTSITTAIGFISLLWINVEPVIEFGISAAVGVIIAFMITYATIPFLLSSMKQNRKGIEKPFSINFRSFRKPILLSFSILFILLGFGIRYLKIDAYLLDDLPDDSEIKHSFQQMDEKLGGSKPWMLYLWNDSIWTPSNMSKLNMIREYLKNKFSVPVLNTPLSAYEYASSVVPNDSLKRIQITRSLSRNSTDTSMLFTGFIPEWGSEKTMSKHEELRKYLEENLKEINWQITGTTYLIDKSHHFLSKNLLFGLITAILAVSICIALFFRSLKWGVITLLPNILTLTSLAGIIGYSGVPLQLSNAIIFSVAFGVVVDDTIHFIAAYRDQNPSKPKWTRIRHTFENTGRSILYTSLVIMTGFSIFLLSGFGATFYMGLFMVISVLLALLIDLFFLPLILPGKN